MCICMAVIRRVCRKHWLADAQQSGESSSGKKWRHALAIDRVFVLLLFSSFVFRWESLQTAVRHLHNVVKLKMAWSLHLHKAFYCNLKQRYMSALPVATLSQRRLPDTMWVAKKVFFRCISSKNGLSLLTSQQRSVKKGLCKWRNVTRALGD